MSRLMVSVSGVRGIVGETLTGEVARQFGAAFAAMLGAGKTVVLGRDSRPSGPMIRDGVIAGLTAGGVNVVDLGIVTTPGVAIMIKHLAADGGIVVTASHNPAPYNGIKFMTPQGLNLPAEQAACLKQIWETQTNAGTVGSGLGTRAAPPAGTVAANDQTHQIHLERVLKVVDVPAVRAKKFKVVLDSINGAGCVGTRLLLDKLGCELVHINGNPDGNFAHEPEPLQKNLTGLCAAVRVYAAGIGFAQDPDGDRLAIVDERGAYIGEEYTLALTAAFVLSQRKGSLATNLSSSRMLDDVAAAAGGAAAGVKVFRTPVGEANVADRMQRAGCIFGGEGGGGVIDPRVVTVRDSFAGIGLMLNYLAATGKTVSQLVAAIPRYEMLKDKFPAPLGAAARVIAAVKAAFAAAPGAHVNEDDGLRIDLPEGWFHVRASNTEPIMRIVAEGTDLSTVRALAAQVRRVAEQALADSRNDQ